MRENSSDRRSDHVDLIEVIHTASHYVLLRGQHSLWLDRTDGAVKTASAWRLTELEDPECMGVCEGFVGRFQTHVDGDHYALLVRDSECVGHLTSGHSVRKVTRVVCLPLSQVTSECQLRPCVKHDSASLPVTSSPALGRTIGRVTSRVTSAAQSASAHVRGRVSSGLRRSTPQSPASSSSNSLTHNNCSPPAGKRTATSPGDCSTDERDSSSASCNAVLEDVLKMFNYTDSFYFSVPAGEGGDITSCLRRVSAKMSRDERFFWNYEMTRCLYSHLTPDSPTFPTGEASIHNSASPELDPSSGDLNEPGSNGGRVDVTKFPSQASRVVLEVEDCRTHEAGESFNTTTDDRTLHAGKCQISYVNENNLKHEVNATVSAVNDPNEEVNAAPANDPRGDVDGPAVSVNHTACEQDIAGRDDEDSPWLLPLIQGFFQTIVINGPDCDEYGGDCDAAARHMRLTLVSRRSRHRAGTRYLRRGVDDLGNVANYVETEQILSCGKHHLSFVQVRGSVPVFWTQSGHQYRPPPRVSEQPQRTQAALARHLDEQLANYSHLHIVNLVEQSGRERALSDAFLDHVLTYNSDLVTYTAFDFHHHCRGLRFENVAVLLGRLSQRLAEAGFTWADDRGPLRVQTAVVRTNCVDCLDRTNVVQTAVARYVLEKQFAKLGVLPTPYSCAAAGTHDGVNQLSGSGACSGVIPEYLRVAFQELWADHGDVISRQYAGTGALKTDFTRTGERRLAGVMRDGVRSANRYYLNQFRDAGRQAVIDALLGRPVNTAAAAASGENSAVPSTAASNVEEDACERVRQMLVEARRLLVTDPLQVLAVWPMVDGGGSSGELTYGENEADTVLLLTRDSFLVATYDDATDCFVSFHSVPLCDLQSIQLLSPAVASATVINTTQNAAAAAARSLLRVASPSSVGSALRSSSSAASGSTSLTLCIRLNYVLGEETGLFVQLRAAAVGVFNNAAPTPLPTAEQRADVLRAICDALLAACSQQDLPAPAVSYSTLERRQSRLLDGESVTPSTSSSTGRGWSGGRMRRLLVPQLRREQRASHSSGANWLSRMWNSPVIDGDHSGNGDVCSSAGVPTIRLPSSSTGSTADLPGTVPADSAGSAGGGLSMLGSSLLSPLSSPARDTVLGGFSLLARGVQRLSPSPSVATALSDSSQRQADLSELLRQRIAGSRTRVTFL